MPDTSKKNLQSIPESGEIETMALAYLDELNLRSLVVDFDGNEKKSFDIAQLIVTVADADKSALNETNIFQMLHIVNLHHTKCIGHIKHAANKTQTVDYALCILGVLAKTNLINAENVTKVLQRTHLLKSLANILQAIGEAHYNTLLNQHVLDTLLESYIGDEQDSSCFAQSISILIENNMLSTERFSELLRLETPKTMLMLLNVLKQYQLLTAANFSRVFYEDAVNEMLLEENIEPNQALQISKFEYYTEVIDTIAKLELPLDQTLLEKIISYKNKVRLYAALIFNSDSMLEAIKKRDISAVRKDFESSIHSASSMSPWPVKPSLVIHTILDATDAYNCSDNILCLLENDALTEESLQHASSDIFTAQLIGCYYYLTTQCQLSLPDLYSHNTESSRQRLLDLRTFFRIQPNQHQFNQTQRQRIVDHPNLLQLTEAYKQLRTFTPQYPDQDWVNRFVTAINTDELTDLVKECNDNLERLATQESHQQISPKPEQKAITIPDNRIEPELLQLAEEKGFYSVSNPQVHLDKLKHRLQISRLLQQIASHYKESLDKIIKGKEDFICLLNEMPSEWIIENFKHIIIRMSSYDLPLRTILRLLEQTEFSFQQRKQIDKEYLSPFLESLAPHIDSVFLLKDLFNYLGVPRIEAVLPQVYLLLPGILKDVSDFKIISSLPVLNQHVIEIFDSNADHITDLATTTYDFMQLISELNKRQRRFVYERRKESLQSMMSPTTLLKICCVFPVSEFKPYYDAYITRALTMTVTIEDFFQAYLNLPTELRDDFARRFQARLKYSILTPIQQLFHTEVSIDLDNEKKIKCFSKNINMAFQVLPLKTCQTLINEFTTYWKLLATERHMHHCRDVCQDLPNSKTQLILNTITQYIRDDKNHEHLNTLLARPARLTAYESLSQFLAKATVVRLNMLNERFPQYLEQIVLLIRCAEHIEALKSELSTDNYAKFAEAIFLILDAAKIVIAENTGHNSTRYTLFSEVPKPVEDILARLTRSNAISSWLTLHASPTNCPEHNRNLISVLQETTSKTIKLLAATEQENTEFEGGYFQPLA